MIKTFYIKTYGCAMNYADSNSIRNLLNNYSLKEVENWKNADLIILVTCSIRQQAEDKVSGWGIKVRKDIFEDKKVVLTGCMAQRYDRVKDTTESKYNKNLKRQFPWIDYIINFKEIYDLPKLLGIENNDLLYSNNINYDTSNKYQGLFTISNGCNNFCSYCIVPYSRGKLVNYPKKEILTSVKDFVANGGKLVTLLGQNVNSWTYGDKDFVDLLKEVNNIEGNFWINFISSHPKDISDDLIELITTKKKFLKHSNIAVQSGSDRILKLMNRKYRAQKFRDICKKIKKINSDFRITTDAIVGFPNESEKDFSKTVQLIKKCDIEMVYIGKYSPREGTKAFSLNDDIPLNIKKEREITLRDTVNETRIKKHKNWVGKKVPVLMYKAHKGISYYNHDVITNEKYKTGEIYELEVKDYSKAGLKC
jgi:tRNA-2-methylthio-N6-dimethylallyladenosine synthase